MVWEVLKGGALKKTRDGIWPSASSLNLTCLGVDKKKSVTSAWCLSRNSKEDPAEHGPTKFDLWGRELN
jgi:hypothetical protein